MESSSTYGNRLPNQVNTAQEFVTHAQNLITQRRQFAWLGWNLLSVYSKNVEIDDEFDEEDEEVLSAAPRRVIYPDNQRPSIAAFATFLRSRLFDFVIPWDRCVVYPTGVSGSGKTYNCLQLLLFAVEQWSAPNRSLGSTWPLAFACINRFISTHTDVSHQTSNAVVRFSLAFATNRRVIGITVEPLWTSHAPTLGSKTAGNKYRIFGIVKPHIDALIEYCLNSEEDYDTLLERFSDDDQGPDSIHFLLQTLKGFVADSDEIRELIAIIAAIVNLARVVFDYNGGRLSIQFRDSLDVAARLLRIPEVHLLNYLVKHKHLSSGGTTLVDDKPMDEIEYDRQCLAKVLYNFVVVRLCGHFNKAFGTIGDETPVKFLDIIDYPGVCSNFPDTAAYFDDLLLNMVRDRLAYLPKHYRFQYEKTYFSRLHVKVPCSIDQNVLTDELISTYVGPSNKPGGIVNLLIDPKLKPEKLTARLLKFIDKDSRLNRFGNQEIILTHYMDTPATYDIASIVASGRLGMATNTVKAMINSSTSPILSNLIQSLVSDTPVFPFHAIFSIDSVDEMLRNLNREMCAQNIVFLHSLLATPSNNLEMADIATFDHTFVARQLNASIAYQSVLHENGGFQVALTVEEFCGAYYPIGSAFAGPRVADSAKECRRILKVANCSNVKSVAASHGAILLSSVDVIILNDRIGRFFDAAVTMQKWRRRLLAQRHYATLLQRKRSYDNIAADFGRALNRVASRFELVLNNQLRDDVLKVEESLLAEILHDAETSDASSDNAFWGRFYVMSGRESVYSVNTKYDLYRVQSSTRAMSETPSVRAARSPHSIDLSHVRSDVNEEAVETIHRMGQGFVLQKMDNGNMSVRNQCGLEMRLWGHWMPALRSFGQDAITARGYVTEAGVTAFEVEEFTALMCLAVRSKSCGARQVAKISLLDAKFQALTVVMVEHDKFPLDKVPLWFVLVDFQVLDYLRSKNFSRGVRDKIDEFKTARCVRENISHTWLKLRDSSASLGATGLINDLVDVDHTAEDGFIDTKQPEIENVQTDVGGKRMWCKHRRLLNYDA